MDMKNVKETIVNYRLEPSKVCACCGEVHLNVPAAYLSNHGLIYFDCRCGNTLALAPPL